MKTLLRRVLELLRILKRRNGNGDDENREHDSPSTADWRSRLSALRQDEYEHSKRVEEDFTACERIQKRLDEAQAAGEKDFNLDRLRHSYEEAKAAFEARRREVDAIRTNIKTLADLVRICEEKIASGSPVDAEQYGRAAQELYITIQTRQSQLQEMEISRTVLDEIRGTSPDVRSVSQEEFDLGSGETLKNKIPDMKPGPGGKDGISREPAC